MRPSRMLALLVLLASAAAAARAQGASRPGAPTDAQRREAVAEMRRRFLEPAGSPPETALVPELDVALFPELDSLKAEAAFVRAGRFEDMDDWATYADMVVQVAERLGVQPPESALAVYRDRVRPSGSRLTIAESRARAALLAAISSPDFAKRYLYIPGLVDTPQPQIAAAPPPPPAHPKKGKRRRSAPRGPELAPPPKSVSVIARIDWDLTDQLADVADANAHNWDRRAKESAKKYARRLRRLRRHCYEWVRRDITALGLWDDRLFRAEVAGTRRDPKRPIRAASFALAMAKVTAAEPLSARTPLRELNLRVDPIVRGAIIVFTQKACGYDPRSGHIEIVTSAVPLRAASYKFHDVKSDCLVRAADQNLVHVYVPLRSEPAPAPALKS